MKLTLIQPTDVPGPLRDRFGAYHLMVERMLAGEQPTAAAPDRVPYLKNSMNSSRMTSNVARPPLG